LPLPPGRDALIPYDEVIKRIQEWTESALDPLTIISRCKIKPMISDIIRKDKRMNMKGEDDDKETL